jgi:hypothetical protein
MFLALRHIINVACTVVVTSELVVFVAIVVVIVILKKRTPWPESASELFRPSDRRLSPNSATFVDRRCHVVSLTDPYGGILDL